MNKTELFCDAMGKIDDTLLDDALSYNAAGAKRMNPLFTVTLSVVLAAFCGSAILLISYRHTPGLKSEITDPGTALSATKESDSGYAIPDKYYDPTVKEAYEMETLKDFLPHNIPDNYVFYRLLTLGLDEPYLITADVFLVDNRGGAIEEAVEKYGSVNFVNFDGGANTIEIIVNRKLELLSVNGATEVDYSDYVSFADLSAEFIESRKVDVDVPQQPRVKGPMYDIFIDAGDYTVSYRYAAFGEEERLTAQDLYRMITSCDYCK